MNRSRTVCSECIAHHYWHHMDDRKRFFKLMMGDFENGMTIPRKFVASIREHISEEVILEVPDGKTYIVQVAKEQNDLVLRSGWADFASAHELKFGDLVVFRNSENSHFKVRIFDPSGCEKGLSCVLIDGAPCVSHGNHTQSPTGQRMEIGSPSSSRRTPKTRPTDSPSRKKGCAPSAKIESPGRGVPTPPYMSPRNRTLNDEQKSKIKEKVRAIQSKIPIYVAVMHSSNFNPTLGIVEFGSDYATNYLPHQNQTMRLRRPDHNKQHTWKAVFQVKNRRHQLVRGWMQFVDDNRLKIGDICLFEQMTDMKKLTMNVHIIRKRSV